MPIPPLLANSGEMRPKSAANSSGSVARVVTRAFFLGAVFFSCFVLYKGADSTGSKIILSGISFSDSLGLDRANYSLERVLKDASMEDKTVILTFLNEAWGSPNSIIDLFLESFRIGEQTRKLLNHLVIIALDEKSFSRCLDLHTHCFAQFPQGFNYSKEAQFMSPVFLAMMWSRINFLISVLELGFNFVFTDADIMWFRDPFPQFYSDADFQISCDHYTGKSDDFRNRPNVGFHFVRSNVRSIEFYKLWYSSRQRYPGLNEQHVLAKFLNDTLVQYIGLKIRYLDTALFGNFCEPSEDLNEVCTMHATCCFGLDNKVHDLRILLNDWKRYMALSPRLKGSVPSGISNKIETIQRRLARPLRKDHTHKSRSGKGSPLVSWRVPQKCSLDAFFHFDVPKKNESQQLKEFDRRHL